MDLASVVAALASVGVRVSGSNPNNNIQGDSSRACPTGLAGPEPSGTHNDPGQHFQRVAAPLPTLYFVLYSVWHLLSLHVRWSFWDKQFLFPPPTPTILTARLRGV